MSWETQSWAAKQRPGSASAKLVLLGLASCADANHCAHPSVQWLCDFSDLNRKTVIMALQRLEDGMFPMIEDTGRRVGRTGQVKVYRINAAKAAGASADPASEAVPKAEPFQKRNSSGSGVKQSQKRDTEPFLEPIPLSSSSDDEAPPLPFGDAEGNGDLPAGAGGDLGGASAPDGTKAGEGRGKRLPDDWTPPPPGELSPVARQLVEQWPSGAYQAVCETFRLHWASETRAIGRKRDWGAALAKWLITDHPKVMRDAKAGVSFARLAPQSPASAVANPVKARAREDQRSAAVRDLLKQHVGERTYQAWLDPVALIVGTRCELVIVSASSFVSDWLRQHFEQALIGAARRVIGSSFGGLKFEIEPASRG